MGRRRAKKTVFLQAGTLEEEAQLNIDSDDEPGGLHIGGAVIYRAPLSSRRAAGRSSSSRHRGSGRPAAAAGPAQLQQELQEWQIVKSDDSLDDELRDYLQNIEQHDEEDSFDSSSSSSSSVSDSEASDAAPLLADEAAALTPRAAAESITPTAAAHTTRDWRLDDADAEHMSSSHPGLGYHPGLGFGSRAAAARFTAVGLDDALEGMLGRDMAEGRVVSDSDSSDIDSDSSYSDADDSSSDIDGQGALQLCALDLDAVDASTAVVVDAQGRPMAVWEQLSPQQRFPVLTRQQQQGLIGPGSQGLTGRAGASSNKGKKPSKQRTPGGQQRTRQVSASSPSGVLLIGSGIISDIKMPKFSSAVTAEAAKSACSAAIAAAGTAAAERQQERKQQRSAVKGARGGELLPGEKKKLRKEKIAAKRAVRRAERGDTALELLATVEEFVASGCDMTLLPPAGKHKQAFTRAIANLYHVKATARGGSSSGKTSLVLQRTPSTALLASDDVQAQQQLQALLTAEIARELTAAAIAAGPAPGSEGKRHKNRSPYQQGLQRQSSRGANAADSAPSVFQQPVAFVSAGVLDPNSMAQQPAAAEALATTTDARTNAAVTAAAIDKHAGGQDVALPQQRGQPEPVSEAETTTADQPSSSKAAARDVGAFLQALLLDSDQEVQESAEAEQTDAGLVAAAAAAQVEPAVGMQQDSLQQQGGQETSMLQQQQEMQQQQQQPEPAAGGWVIDKQPQISASSRGLGFAATVVPADMADATADVAPVYERTTTGLGFGPSNGSPGGLSIGGLGTGLGFAPSSSNTGLVEGVGAPTAAAVAGGSSGTVVGSDGRLNSSSKDSSSRQALQDLEYRFTNLRAVGNPHAARRQQRRQQREQQQHRALQQQLEAEQRLLNPNTALGPSISGMLVTEATAVNVTSSSRQVVQHERVGMSMTLGLTAQQVKKAKKQQLRNQRREARAAAAGLDTGVDEFAVQQGNVSNSFAGFEAHTTGIGSRLMGRWGWTEGEGLGRARHGRAEPLQASRRPKQLGLGAE